MSTNHLATWTSYQANVAFRVDLWDTGRTDHRGASVLRYSLGIIPQDLDKRPIILDGEDYSPSPLISIDSDESAAGLIGFFAAYAEMDPASDDAPTFTARQWEALKRYSDELSMWAHELDNDD